MKPSIPFWYRVYQPIYDYYWHSKKCIYYTSFKLFKRQSFTSFFATPGLFSKEPIKSLLWGGSLITVLITRSIAAFTNAKF